MTERKDDISYSSYEAEIDEGKNVFHGIYGSVAARADIDHGGNGPDEGGGQRGQLSGKRKRHGRTSVLRRVGRPVCAGVRICVMLSGKNVSGWRFVRTLALPVKLRRSCQGPGGTVPPDVMRREYPPCTVEPNARGAAQKHPDFCSWWKICIQL